LDESTDFGKMEQWAVWAHRNPGPGRTLRTFATIGLPQAVERTPSVDIVASTPDESMRGPTPYAGKNWQSAFERLRKQANKSIYFYNGSRPASGSFTTDDDGIAPRQLGWIQFALGIERWFKWESTYYDNIHHNTGETNVFRSAHTFGDITGIDPAMGETGNNYDNGNGLLFYPGTDLVFPDESYGVEAPIASLRLKHWRRGVQDHDYLVMAARLDDVKVKQIVAGLISHALWDKAMGALSNDDGWTTNPDTWEAARRQLADIIEGGESKRTQLDGANLR
jgi:hypothetical protein